MTNRKIRNPVKTYCDVSIELARREFRDFIRQAWHVVEPARPLIPAWHMDAIALRLQAVTEGKIRNLLINVPPGHAKSLIVSVLWPAWRWIHDAQGAQFRGLFASYNSGLAIRDSVRCRALMESPWYRGMFRPAWKLKTDQNEKHNFENTESGSRMCLSVGGAGSGHRGDAIIVDDPLNASDQYSEAARSVAVCWWDYVMSSRLNSMETGSKIIIMQRLHQMDLSDRPSTDPHPLFLSEIARHRLPSCSRGGEGLGVLGFPCHFPAARKQRFHLGQLKLGRSSFFTRIAFI